LLLIIYEKRKFVCVVNSRYGSGLDFLKIKVLGGISEVLQRGPKLLYAAQAQKVFSEK